jgi:hypothetical protein
MTVFSVADPELPDDPPIEERLRVSARLAAFGGARLRPRCRFAAAGVPVPRLMLGWVAC